MSSRPRGGGTGEIIIIYVSRLLLSRDEENTGRRTAATWLPVAHGGALASDFSSGRWKGVTASEDGRRDATINRGLTRRRRTSSILSSAPSLRVLSSFSLSLFLFPFPSARHSGDLFLPPESHEVSSRRGRLTVEAGEMTLIIPSGFYARYSCLTYRWSEREQLSGLDHPRLMRTFSSSSLRGADTRENPPYGMGRNCTNSEFGSGIACMLIIHCAFILETSRESAFIPRVTSRTILKPSFRARSNAINGDTMAVASSFAPPRY